LQTNTRIVRAVYERGNHYKGVSENQQAIIAAKAVPELILMAQEFADHLEQLAADYRADHSFTLAAIESIKAQGIKDFIKILQT
jgi:hypothetical protein